MRVLLTFFLTLSLLNLAGQARLNTDSLWKVYADQNEIDSNRLKAIHVMAWQFVFTHPDSSIVLAHLQNTYALQRKLPKYQGGALNTIGVAFMNKGDLDSALLFDEQALRIREKIGDRKGCAVSLNNIGTVHYQQGDYLKAIDYYQRSMKIKEELKDYAGVAAAYSNIGMIYENDGNWEDSKQYTERALHLRDSIKDIRGMADSYGRLGGYYSHFSQYVKALEMINKSIYFYSQTSDRKGFGNSVSNLGLVYDNMGRFDSAFACYKRAYEIRLLIGDKEGISNSLILLGVFENDRKDYKAGRDFCEQALQIADDIEFAETQLNACNCLSVSYDHLGDAAKALLYYKRAALIDDSLSNSDMSKAIARKTLQYDYQKRALADSLRTAQEERVKDILHSEEIARQKNVTLFAIGGSILLLLVVFILIRGSRQKQKINSILEEQNRVITHQKNVVEEQKAIVEEKQKQILDSIHYARSIQQSLLPTEKSIDKNLDRLKKGI